MSVYVDNWGDYHPLATVQVVEEQRVAKVTYRSEAGQRFSVNVRQVPNPVGFRARLPGDEPKRGAV